MPNEANMVVEREYIRYRENYNSFWYQEHAYFPFKPYRVWIDMFNSHVFWSCHHIYICGFLTKLNVPVLGEWFLVRFPTLKTFQHIPTKVWPYGHWKATSFFSLYDQKCTTLNTWSLATVGPMLLPPKPIAEFFGISSSGIQRLPPLRNNDYSTPTMFYICLHHLSLWVSLWRGSRFYVSHRFANQDAWLRAPQGQCSILPMHARWGHDQTGAWPTTSHFVAFEHPEFLQAVFQTLSCLWHNYSFGKESAFHICDKTTFFTVQKEHPTRWSQSVKGCIPTCFQNAACSTTAYAFAYAGARFSNPLALPERKIWAAQADWEGGWDLVRHRLKA